MRISLLVRREPFGTILERTLERFWTAQHGHPYRVHWQPGPWLRAQPHTVERQAWLANVYLNAIFTYDVRPGVLDPIRREFSRSPVWWRGPAQRAYAGAALSRIGSRWLAQAGLEVSPPVPDAPFKLIVAGNHKLRLLDRQAGLAYGILKEGFHDRFWQRELAARQAAAECGVPVPELLDVAREHGFFRERYASGTPANRLSSRAAAEQALVQIAGSLQPFYRATEAETSAADYARQLAEQIERLVGESRLLVPAKRQEILGQAGALAAELEVAVGGKGWGIRTAFTHGDLQPANILVNGDGAWLIDWEFAGRRQAGYDALVLGLGARFPRGLAGRLLRFVERGWPSHSPVFAQPWPGLLVDSRRQRHVHAVLFLLEELALRLEEQSQPPLIALGQGLQALQLEIHHWTGERIRHGE